MVSLLAESVVSWIAGRLVSTDQNISNADGVLVLICSVGVKIVELDGGCSLDSEACCNAVVAADVDTSAASDLDTAAAD